MTYFSDKSGTSYVALKMKDGLKLNYSAYCQAWTSKYRGTTTAAIKECADNECEYLLKVGHKEISLNVCEVAELAILLKEFVRGKEFTQYRRMEVK